MRHLKVGMALEEALLVCDIPEECWLRSLGSFDLTLETDLGPGELPNHGLELIFLFSPDDDRMHLTSWRIVNNKWK